MPSKRIKSISLWCLCFLVTVITYLIFLKIKRIVPLYETIDDLYIKMISSGEFTGTTQFRLLHITVVAGLLLKCLYGLFPGLSWYGIWLLFCILISFSTFLWVFVNRFFSEKYAPVKILVSLILYITLFICFWSVPTFFIQYTTVTIILAATALVLFYDENYAGSVIFYILSFSLRMKAAVMMLPFLFLMTFVKWIKNKKDKGLLILGIILSAMILIFVTEKISYKSEDWSEFRRYNTARENIVDYNGYPDYELYRDTYERYGISEASYEAARDGYLLLFDNGFTADSMEALGKLSPKHAAGRTLFTMIKDFVYRHLVSYEDRPLNILVYFLYLFVFILTIVRKNKNAFMDLCVIFTGRMTVWAYLIFIDRAPVRITQGVYIAESFLLLYLIVKHEFIKPEARKTDIVTMLVFLSVTAFLSAKWGIGHTDSYVGYSNSRMGFVDSYREMREYMAEREDSFFMLDTNSFLYFCEPVITDNPEGKANFAYLGCWTANSPWNDEIAEKNGFDDYEKLPFERENVYFVFMNTAVTGYEYLEKYYKRVYPDVGVWEETRYTTAEGLEFIFVKIS